MFLKSLSRNNWMQNFYGVNTYTFHPKHGTLNDVFFKKIGLCESTLILFQIILPDYLLSNNINITGI